MTSPDIIESVREAIESADESMFGFSPDRAMACAAIKAVLRAMLECNVQRGLANVPLFDREMISFFARAHAIDLAEKG